MYGVLLVPVLFGLLLGLNLLVWARSSINYVFIFGKNTSTSFREYITNFVVRAGHKHPTRLSTIF